MEPAPKLLGERHERIALLSNDEHCAEINRCASEVLGEDATADALLCLKHDGAMTEPTQLSRRRKTCDPSADDKDCSTGATRWPAAARQRHMEGESWRRVEVDDALTLEHLEYDRERYHAPDRREPRRDHAPLRRCERKPAARTNITPQPEEEVAACDGAAWAVGEGRVAQRRLFQHRQRPPRQTLLLDEPPQR
jgi:hypothetical protein